MDTDRQVDVAVIGGGLAGLTAAIVAARQGASVSLFERSAELGGRARTQEEVGFLMNLGPHALYDGGPARRVLNELGVTYTGGSPRVSGNVLHEGKLHTAPAGARSLLSTSLFGPGAKLEAGRFLAKLPKLDASNFDSVTVDEWLLTTFKRVVVRQFFAALFRLSTYTNAPAILSAGVALRQLQIGMKPVLYLDGGWQVLVDQLEAKARAAGVTLVNGARVERIETNAVGHVIHFGNGSICRSTTVVITGSPELARDLIPDAPGSGAWVQPVARVACLDVGLARLPVDRNFVLGIDAPLYLSVHSAVARLAPEGQALVSVAKYIPAGEDAEPERDLRELEALLDIAQPGWQDVVVTRRFLPSMVVANGVPTAAIGGFTGRPPIDAAGVPGLYLAGDWIGPEGNLSDASFGSGWAAGKAAATFAATHGLPARVAV